MTEYVKQCPGCQTERPQHEDVCAGELPDGSPCRFDRLWDIMPTLAREAPPGVQPALRGDEPAGSADGSPPDRQSSAHSEAGRTATEDRASAPPAPASANGAACPTCRVAVEPDDAICLECGAVLGNSIQAPKTPRRVGDWLIAAELPPPTPDADLFLVRRSEGGSIALLRLLADGIAPDRGVYSVLESLDHPSIPHLLAHGRDGERVFEVWEHIDGPTLAEIAPVVASDPEVLEQVAGALIGALTLFERRGLRHGNLQPSVIRARGLTPLALAIVDYTTASITEFDVQARRPRALTRYMAPEAIADASAAASDWWSLGIILLELLTQGRCFAGVHDRAFLLHLVSRGVAIPEDIRPRWRNLLEGLLTRDHAKRWRSEKALQWLTSDKPVPTEYEGSGGPRPEGELLPFAGLSFTSPADLALFAAQDAHWSDALVALESGRLATWLATFDKKAKKGESYDLVSRIGSDNRIPADVRLALALAAMNKDMPLCVRGAILSPSALLADVPAAGPWLSAPVLSVLRRMKRTRDQWLLHLAERSDRVRARARDARLEIDEENFAVLRLVTSPAALDARWAKQRAIFPDSSHATVASLIERRLPSDEDLLLLLCLKHRHFKPLDEVLREARSLASGHPDEQPPVPEFDADAAKAWLVRPRRDLSDELNERIPSFERCMRQKVDDWVDSFRSANRRMPLARLIVTLAVPVEEWREPPQQDYIRSVLGLMHRRVLAGIQKGSLVQMRTSSSNLDLSVLPEEIHGPLLDAIVSRGDQDMRLGARSNTTAAFFNSVRDLDRKARNFNRDTGMEALYVGFPFLTLLDRTEDGDRTRVAPLLLWPVRLNVATGAAGSITLACDLAREVVINPALETILGALAFERWCQIIGTATRDGFDSRASVLRALGDLVESGIAEQICPMPRPASVKRANVPEIRPAAALFLAEFPSQAIAHDLKALQAQPLDGTALHCLLRLGQHEKRNRQDRIPQAERFGTLEADPSQEDAVARSRCEPGLVVQGPPGTGKSQTIVNIITDCLGRGESVLVICEKKAALDVVQKRLAAERLGDRVVRVENTTADRTALVNALKAQVPALLNDPVNHALSARQKRLPIAGKIDALEAELDTYHEAIHATAPRLQMSHREILSLIAGQSFAARGLSAPLLRSILGPLSPAELETVIGTCAGLVDIWLAGAVPGRALAVLKPFATDSAQAEGIGALLQAYFAAELQRLRSFALLKALPQRYRSLTSPDNDVLARWLQVHGSEIGALPPASLQRCAAWRPYFSANGALRDEAAKVKAALSELLSSLATMAMTGPAALAHEAVSGWPEADIATLAKALPLVKKSPSMWGHLNIPAVLRRRYARRLLTEHRVAPERTATVAHAEAATFETQVRRSAARLGEIAAQLAERAIPAAITHRALLSGGHALMQEIAAFERFAGIVDACPVPDLWLHIQAAVETAHDPTAAPLAPLIAALEAARQIAFARAESRRALDALRPYLADIVYAREQTALATDAPSSIDADAICAALPVMVPYQTYRLRYAGRSETARACLDVLYPLASELSCDPERPARAKLEALMRREAATAWKAEIETHRPHLQRLQSEILTEIGELGTLDTKIRDANRRLLATVDREKIKDQTAWAPAWAGGPSTKRLRQIFEIGRQLGLLDLKPVWLVNPDVASRMLPLEPGLFDVAIFDEASQMRVVNALPGLFRAKRCVISGDEKQLPPTTFFGPRADSAGDGASDDAADAALADEDVDHDDEDAETAPRLDPRMLKSAERHIKDCEDLLALARGLLPESSLDIHYRSEFRELIAFSNAAYYAGRLNVPVRKSPTEVRTARPIEVLRVDGEYKNQTNPAEAEKIVEVLSEIWARDETPPTLGVVTFNMKQAELIASRLDARADQDRAFAKAYLRERTRKAQGEDVGFFVKNLENVQGDERDWIVFSTTFGRDADGVFKRAFGALNQEGGERRLNVAVTRAKRKNLIVTSMPVAEISDILDSRRPPVRARDYLQLYMHFAGLVSDGQFDDATKLLEMFGPQDDGGAQLRQTEPDELIAQALGTLQAEGFAATALPRHDAFSLDIAVSEPGSARYVLGIEIDSPRHTLLRRARAREVWRPKLLARSGLRLHRIASAEWVRNPDAERARLVAAARQAIEGADA